MHGHAHKLAGLDELTGNPDVFFRGFRIPTGMVMRTDDRGGVGEDGHLEHLARFHDGSGQAADANLGQTGDDVRRVQEDN